PMAAVRRQCRELVLQGEPARLWIDRCGHDDKRTIADAVLRCRLRKRRGKLDELVAQAAVMTRGRMLVVQRQQSSDADSSQRRKQRIDAAKAVVERWIRGKTLECVGGLSVEQDHPCNLIWI